MYSFKNPPYTGKPLIDPVLPSNMSGLKTNKYQWSELVFNNSIDPIIIEDLNGVIIDLNHQAEVVYGYRREELIGRPIQTIIPPERHAQSKELLNRCLAGEEVRDIEGLRQNKEKVISPVMLALSALKDKSGEIVAVATIAKDLSAFKKMEAEKQQMVQVFMDAADPIIIEDLNGIILEINKEAERSYGYTKEELIGLPIRTLVPPERHAQAVDLLERCLAGEKVRNVEGLRWNKDREISDVLLSLSALKNEHGKIEAIATIAKDITDIKRAESELVKHQHLLEVRVGERTQELQKAQNELEILADKLSHYLSPQIYSSIFEGRNEPGIAARRRWLTVFFSDIVKFTETTESMAPEELTTLLNEYFSEMTSIVVRYGGTLDKYIGDAIMVFFGDPETRGREEDAFACVSMALEMQARLEDLRQQWSHRGVQRPFHVRIGISSGYNTVGNFGDKQQMSYTVIGRQVNLASRLQSAANPDGILISKATWSLVQNKVRTVKENPITVKGFEDPVDVYTVLGILDEHTKTSVFQKYEPGFSLWLDLQRLTRENRQTAARYLQQILDSLKDDIR